MFPMVFNSSVVRAGEISIILLLLFELEKCPAVSKGGVPQPWLLHSAEVLTFLGNSSVSLFHIKKNPQVSSYDSECAKWPLWEPQCHRRVSNTTWVSCPESLVRPCHNFHLLSLLQTELVTRLGFRALKCQPPRQGMRVSKGPTGRLLQDQIFTETEVKLWNAQLLEPKRAGNRWVFLEGLNALQF